MRYEKSTDWKFIIFAVITILFGASSELRANGHEDCLRIDSDVARLECYDAVFDATEAIFTDAEWDRMKELIIAGRPTYSEYAHMTLFRGCIYSARRQDQLTDQWRTVVWNINFETVDLSQSREERDAVGRTIYRIVSREENIRLSGAYSVESGNDYDRLARSTVVLLNRYDANEFGALLEKVVAACQS